jgi:tryptophan synthase alpha chain
VDLPPEEAVEYKAEMEQHEVATIFLLAPTSTEDRIEAVARQSTGFVYYVSRRGVTGMQASIDTGVHGMVDAIKKHTDTPVAVGFGVSTPEQAKEIAGYADGVIVGSAIVRMVGELGDTDDMPLTVGAFVKTLADGAKGLR